MNEPAKCWFSVHVRATRNARHCCVYLVEIVIRRARRWLTCNRASWEAYLGKVCEVIAIIFILPRPGWSADRVVKWHVEKFVASIGSDIRCRAESDSTPRNHACGSSSGLREADSLLGMHCLDRKL